MQQPSSTEDGSFRAAVDDVIIIPLVFVVLAANKSLRFILSILRKGYFPFSSGCCPVSPSGPLFLLRFNLVGLN